jgi:hypothetical protein
LHGKCRRFFYIWQDDLAAATAVPLLRKCGKLLTMRKNKQETYPSSKFSQELSGECRRWLHAHEKQARFAVSDGRVIEVVGG